MRDNPSQARSKTRTSSIAAGPIAPSKVGKPADRKPKNLADSTRQKSPTQQHTRLTFEYSMMTFSTFHPVARRVQDILEATAWAYGMKYFPTWMHSNNFQVPTQLEISAWDEALRKTPLWHTTNCLFNEQQKRCSASGAQLNLQQAFKNVRDLRNHVVHRRTTTYARFILIMESAIIIQRFHEGREIELRKIRDMLQLTVSEHEQSRSSETAEAIAELNQLASEKSRLTKKEEAISKELLQLDALRVEAANGKMEDRFAGVLNSAMSLEHYSRPNTIDQSTQSSERPAAQQERTDDIGLSKSTTVSAIHQPCSGPIESEPSLPCDSTGLSLTLNREESSSISCAADSTLKSHLKPSQPLSQLVWVDSGVVLSELREKENCKAPKVQAYDGLFSTTEMQSTQTSENTCFVALAAPTTPAQSSTQSSTYKTGLSLQPIPQKSGSDNHEIDGLSDGGDRE